MKIVNYNPYLRALKIKVKGVRGVFLFDIFSGRIWYYYREAKAVPEKYAYLIDEIRRKYDSINKLTFNKNTTGVFQPAEPPARKPDYISKSGSEYWYTDEGVYRRSNHWGVFRLVNWKLETDKPFKNYNSRWGVVKFYDEPLTWFIKFKDLRRWD